MDDMHQNSIILSRSKEMSPRIGLWYSQMEEVRNRLHKIVLEIKNQGIIDYTPNERKIETIGTLLLHIAAIEWSWIFEDIDGLEMNYEEWKYAFALRPSVNLIQLTGKNVYYYINRLNMVREQVHQRMLRMTDDDLNKLVKSDNKYYSIEWILFHIIEHETIHIGQINLLKRLFELKNYV